MSSDGTFGMCESNGAACVTKKLIEQFYVIITFQRVVKYLICECVILVRPVEPEANLKVSNA